MRDEVKELVGSKRVFIFYIKSEGCNEKGGIRRGMEI